MIVPTTLEPLPPGPRVGCTFGGRSRPWGPPVSAALGEKPALCYAEARWVRVGTDTAWFLCDDHRDAA